MKLLILVLIIIFHWVDVLSFDDDSHFSEVFNKVRFFRVFTPPDYNQADTTKRYPVIYYFHGCGGSYKSSGSHKYSAWGLTPPVAVGRDDKEDYEYPNNADFDNFTYNNDVIIISVDGKIEGLDGCGVYFPSLASLWEGNYYNFSDYIRELTSIIDERYNTKKGSQYRAISGLSMGGQVAIWLAAANPHFFSSASEFCYSPSYFDVGDPSYITTIDVKELWRNLRGVPFRHSTNDRDWLRYYTEQLNLIYSGAGFSNEYYLAEFCRHWAARIDLQFDFHMKHFNSEREKIKCFSFINLYPDFEVWGYNISSSKKGSGWIYLRDVTDNGFGIYTRKRLPWGGGLSPFVISVNTPAIYTPDQTYMISRYSYRNNTFTSEETTADSLGRIVIGASGGVGEEIGIIGEEFQPPVFVLTDTINENIYLNDNKLTALTFEVVNLSFSPQTVNFIITSENDDILSIKNGTKQVELKPLSKKRIDSLVICMGTHLPLIRNTGYIKIRSSIDGVIQDREQIFQVNVINFESDKPEVKIFDGKSETIPLFKYGWGNRRRPIEVSTDEIKEGSGNGNGKAEFGETFSIWIQPYSAFDSEDINTWHPAVPLNNRLNPDISVIEVKHHLFNTGSPVLSAQLRLNRPPTKENPVIIPVKSRFLNAEPLENDCHRDTADNFRYFYYNIKIFKDGTAEVIRIPDK